MTNYKRDPLSLFLRIIVMAAAFITVSALAFIIIYILIKGVPNLKPSLFSWAYNSENVSLMPAFINTILMAALTLLISVPVGIGSAVYLTEYAKKGNKLVGIVRITTETLSGIPSIVYGLFGALFFVKAWRMGFFAGGGLDLSLISGALTLAIMVLPLIMRTTEEALIAVPDMYREGSFGLGAGKLRTVFQVVLPSAVPGILSGIILAIGRIVGESAALIFTAGTVAEVATGLSSSARTLAVHMYVISGEGLYIEETYATAVVLLILVILINTVSGLIAQKISKGTGE